MSIWKFYYFWIFLLILNIYKIYKISKFIEFTNLWKNFVYFFAKSEYVRVYVSVCMCVPIIVYNSTV